MKQVLTTVLLTICCATAQAQNEIPESVKTYNHAIKLYATGMFNPYDGVYLRNIESFTRQSSFSDYVQPTLAVMLRNKDGNYHELELSQVSVRSTEFGTMTHGPGATPIYRPDYRLLATRIAARYEFILPLIKKRNALFVPAAGLAVMPYYSRNRMTPYSTANVPITMSALGAKTFIVPHLQVNLSKRIFIDANIPICLTDFSRVRQDIKNPTLPVNAQKYTIADVRFLPKFYTARLGIGVKL
ncbi:MAG: hypothetical protein K8F30_01685 [Taibaiella sp.]|nr:hypothetical protein [Taibaiella sp.]